MQCERSKYVSKVYGDKVRSDPDGEFQVARVRAADGTFDRGKLDYCGAKRSTTTDVRACHSPRHPGG